MSWNCNKGGAQTRHTHTACYVSGVLSNRCCQMLNSGENVWGWGVGGWGVKTERPPDPL